MRIHHLNAGTLCPGAAQEGGRGPGVRLVCHVLVIETGDGLVLVDTGLGTQDIAGPERLGASFQSESGPLLDPAETAYAQVRALGFAAADVRHIIPTHLDLDHAGGMGDFPWAQVHVYRREHAAAMERAGERERRRYVAEHFAHGPRWRLVDEGGDSWFGFSGVRELGTAGPDLLLVPLPGHTAGHSGVAVRTDGGRWLLHAGDAYVFRGQMATPPIVPPAVLAYQERTDTDRALRAANEDRLRALRAEHSEAVTGFCAHDLEEYNRLARPA